MALPNTVFYQMRMQGCNACHVAITFVDAMNILCIFKDRLVVNSSDAYGSDWIGVCMLNFVCMYLHFFFIPAVNY